MKLDFRNHAYLTWVGGMTALTFVLALIVWILVPIGPWMAWFVLCGFYLGCVAAFIDIHSIQGRCRDKDP